MAIIISITKNDTEETIKKKLNSIGDSTKFFQGFKAKKFTGKIKSFEEGLAFKNSLRNKR